MSVCQQIDTRFSTITEVGNYGVSNYNGLTASFTRRVSDAFQLQASFTWSHALDDVSNGGFLPFNLGTNASILNPQNPYCFRCSNDGNADYDARHQFNATYIWHTPKLHNLFLNLIADWTISGTFFYRTGLPFTVIDGADTGTLNGFNCGNFLFADSNVGPVSCSGSAVFNNFVTTTPCMNPSQFPAALSPSGTFSFGNQRRNQVYGPWYFNTDLTLMKNFRFPKWEGAEIQIGAQAFNILNHPNFDQPVGDVSNPPVRIYQPHGRYAHQHLRLVPGRRRFPPRSPDPSSTPFLTTTPNRCGPVSSPGRFFLYPPP